MTWPNSRQWPIVVALLLIEILLGVGIVFAQEKEPLKGIAMAVYNLSDLKSLNADVFYTWGFCQEAQCIPMVRSAQVPPICPEILLVGNEPNAIEPYGSPSTPKEFAEKVVRIEKQCPNTKQVAGNVSVDDWKSLGGTGKGRLWLYLFLKEYKRITGNDYVDALGVHCYTQHLAQYCIEELAQIKRVWGGELWITEWGVVSGDVSQFIAFMNYVGKNFDAGFVYTNRQPHTGLGWELPGGTELMSGEDPTDIGIVFRDTVYNSSRVNYE